MKNHSLSAVICCSLGALTLTACSNDKKEPTIAQPTATRQVTTQPGVAGSVTEDAVTIEAIVTEINEPDRKVTLKGPEGQEHTFDINPQIRDISKLRVGDKVTATFGRRVYVGVKREDAPPSETFESTWGSSGRGDMPARISAQETRKVGRITAIDQANRTADVMFADNVTKRVEARPDVDLSKYKVGDNVIIRVTSALTILSKKP